MEGARETPQNDVVGMDSGVDDEDSAQRRFIGWMQVQYASCTSCMRVLGLDHAWDSAA